MQYTAALTPDRQEAIMSKLLPDAPLLTRYGREHYDRDSPYSEVFTRWYDDGRDILDVIPAAELDEHLSVASSHENTPYHQGDPALQAFAADLAEALVAKWAYTANGQL